MKRIKGLFSSTVFIFFCLGAHIFSEDLLLKYQRETEKITTEEKRIYVKNLGVEKALLLANQVWSICSESAYWVGYYGIIPRWREDTYEIVKSVPLIYSEDKLNPGWREMMKNSLWEYMRKSEFSIGIDVINKSLQFVRNQDNASKDRSCVVLFIEDSWFDYFENANKFPKEKRTETFNTLNLQVEKILKGIAEIPATSPEIEGSKNNLLNRLHVLYKKKLLPSEFTGNINFARIKTLVENTHLSGTKTN
ncbi:hypothetical protein M0P98_03630 [bacterium]|nr:hypothetical protein [bacterium]